MKLRYHIDMANLEKSKDDLSTFFPPLNGVNSKQEWGSQPTIWRL